MNKTALIAAWCGLSVSSVVHAQTAVRGTTGFPIGEKSRIHVLFDSGVGFDSNPARLSENAARSDWKAYFLPGVEVDVPGSSVQFGLEGKMLIEQFFGTQAAADTKFGGHVGTRLRLGSQSSVVGLELVDTLSRTPTIFAQVGAVGADEIRFVQWYNSGLANLVLRPGGGALEFRLGYGNELRFYDDLPRSQEHYANFEAKLRFLPKTAVLFAADLGFFSADTSGTGGTTRRSSPYNLTLGLQGQITERLSTQLRVGFGDSLTWNGDFFSDVSADNIRTIIAGVSIAYAFIPGSSFTLGYERAIKPVVLLDAYTSDAPFAALRLGLAGGRLGLALHGQFELRTFAGDADAKLVTLDSRIDYWFFEFLRAGIGYQLLFQASGTPVGATSGIEEYTRHQGFVFAGLYY